MHLSTTCSILNILLLFHRQQILELFTCGDICIPQVIKVQESFIPEIKMQLKVENYYLHLVPTTSKMIFKNASQKTKMLMNEH